MAVGARVGLCGFSSEKEPTYNPRHVEMPFAAGAPVGPCQILAPLGSGGIGEVYRARDPRLDRAAPDGQRFLVGSAAAAPFTVVVNWPSELKP
jgi:hypothetical protein